MSDLGGFLNISYSNSFYFRNGNNNDILIYPETSNQVIRIGITSNSTSLLDISSNAVYINSANFGIGLSNPANALDVVDSNNALIMLTEYNSGDGVTIRCRRAQGTPATPSNLAINQSILGLRAFGYNGTSFNRVAYIDMVTAENYTNSTSNGAYIMFATTQIGTSTNIERMRIADNGNVGIGTTTPGYTLDIAGGLQVRSNIITPGLQNRIWDFSGTISDTSQKPGYVGLSYITGCNITVSSNTPFSNLNTEGSIYLPGITGNYITMPQLTSTGTSSFTIESWIYLQTTPTIANGLPYLIGNMNPTTITSWWSFGINQTNNMVFYNTNGGTVLISGTALSNQTWYHIAVSYSNSSTTQLYLNGIAQTLTVTGTGTSGNGTIAATIPGVSNSSSLPLIIGQYYGVSLNAYISNLRWTNSVLYTSNFTPSTYPLQVYNSNTQLLLRAPLQNPIINTNSIHTYDSLRTHCLPSDAIIYADCYGTNLPNLSGSYTPIFDSNLTKSIVFNRANSNHISYPSQTFNIATKGFSAISKFMLTSNVGTYEYERLFEFGVAVGNNNIILYRNVGANRLNFLINNGTINSVSISPSYIFSQNMIYTIAVKYDPFLGNNSNTYFGTMSMFVNGSNIYSLNITTTPGLDRFLSNIYIGRSSTTSDAYLNGNIYNMSIYNRALTDKEIQDASIMLMVEPSLPNKAIVEIGNANGKPALTIQQDGSLQIAGPITTTNNQSYSIVDYGVYNTNVSSFINGSVPTSSYSPFTTLTDGSLYINNSNTSTNFIGFSTSLNSNAWHTSSGFTMEGWVNYLNFSNVISGSGMPTTLGNGVMSLGINNSSNLSFCYYNGSNIPLSGSTYMQSNIWYHIAVTYDMSYIRLFLNGQIQNSNVISGSPVIQTNINIGATNSIYLSSAYITNLRVVYGSALYTSNFIPSSSPLNPSPTGTTTYLVRVPQNSGKVLIPKIGGTTQVQAYPPAPLTGYVTNIQNTSYGAGYYVVSASSEVNSTYIAYNAFIYNGITRWASGYNYSSASPYNYIGSVSTTDINGYLYSGDFLQIKLPYSIILNSYSFATIDTVNNLYILGSKDGILWSIISSKIGVSIYNTSVSYQVNTNSSYQYYRMVISQINSNQSITSIYNFRLYGTQESINITPDGQVGIGVTQPKQQLEVAGNTIIYGNMQIGGSTNNVGNLQIGSNILTPGLQNRIWDFSGTISDTSQKPGYVSTSYITGCNITVSSNTPFSNLNTEGSIYLPGIAGNYITLQQQPTTASLGTFTIETWINMQTMQTGLRPYLIGNMSTTIGTNYWSFGINNNSNLTLYGYINSLGGYIICPLSNLSTNTWYHIAMCYSNNSSVQMFINGTLQTLSTNNATILTGSNTTTATLLYGISNNNTVPLLIGQCSTSNLNAYISNLRWTNSILYTSSFTPSPYPLQVYNNKPTQLLLRAPLYNPIIHTNSIHTYDSLRTHCLPSDAMIYLDCYGTNLPNLSPTPPLFDSNITKSIVFTPTNSNYLSFPPQTFNIATKGFTAICKMMTTSNYAGAIVSSYNSGDNLISLYQTNGINNGFLMKNGLTQVGNAFINGSTSMNTINTTICRYDPYTNQGTVTTFINGSNVASSNNWNASIGTDRVLTSINIGNPSSPYIPANIYNLAVYNRALTDKEIQDAFAALIVEPSLPNKAVIEIGNANGKPALTVQQDGSLQIAGPITTTNNQSYAPQDFGVYNFSIPGSIVGTVSPISTSPFNSSTEGSVYLTTGNSITISNSIFSTSISGRFTCESWVNYTSLVSTATFLYTYPSGTPSWGLGNSGTSLYCTFFNGSSTQTITGSSTMNINTWYHVAMTYDGSSARIFLNGNLQGTNTTAINFSGAAVLNIANNSSIYVTNTRVVYGSALYTTNFTPPIGPIGPSPTGTTALLMRVPQNPGKVLIPKIGGTTQVRAYPPSPLTGYVTNVQNTSYGAGYYITSASSQYSSTFLPYNAFDKNFTSSPNWSSVGNYTSAGVYTGTNSSIDINGNTYYGEWLQLQMPVNIMLSCCTILSSSGFAIASCSILASKDGVRWINLCSQSGVLSTYLSANINANVAYNYFRIVITSLQGTGTNTSVCEIVFYGTQESINITPDGQVGLGVTQPKQQLEVAGNAMIYGNISAGNLGIFRNRIINGDMTIDQRGSATAPVTTTATYSVDRFQLGYTIASGSATLGQASITDLPGFKNCIQLILTNAVYTNAINFSGIVHRPEGINMVDLSWGTLNAQPITFSFWIKSTVAGTYCVAFRSNDSARTYIQDYSVNTANVWQYISFTIPGDVGGTTTNTLGSWPTNNYQFMAIFWTFGTSADFQQTPFIWLNGNMRGSANQSKLGSGTVQITGVQFEKGTIATPFEFRPYAMELQLCQRYYYQVNSPVQSLCPMVIISSTAAQGVYKLPIAMRINTPILSYSVLPILDWFGVNANNMSGLSIPNSYCTNSDITLYSTGVSAGTAGAVTVGSVRFLFLGSGYIGFSAEL